MNQNYYNEKMDQLDENLRYAIIMSDWQKSLITIKDKFKLHIDQTQILEDSVVKLMFGDIDASDFINNLFNDGHINSETAADILLEIDSEILKKIRERLEQIEEEQEKEQELEYLLSDEDEQKQIDESNSSADYYDQLEQIMKETEESMKEEGIKEDGSNITDEMLGVKTELPDNIEQEKQDLMAEIENPTKTKSYISFGEPIIDTEHQLENKELETPYTEEKIIKEEPVEEEKKYTNTQVVTNNTVKKPEIKKPINIKMADIYREPLE